MASTCDLACAGEVGEVVAAGVVAGVAAGDFPVANCAGGAGLVVAGTLPWLAGFVAGFVAGVVIGVVAGAAAGLAAGAGACVGSGFAAATWPCSGFPSAGATAPVKPKRHDAVSRELRSLRVFIVPTGSTRWMHNSSKRRPRRSSCNSPNRYNQIKSRSTLRLFSWLGRWGSRWCGRRRC